MRVRDLPNLEKRGFLTHQRGNFCINIEPSDNYEECQENTKNEVLKLIQILTSKEATLLPWKEKDYAKSKEINPTNIGKIQHLTYAELRKIYIDNGFFWTGQSKVYLYLYLGFSKKYSAFRGTVERDLKEADIIWYKRTLQAERRYLLGYVTGSHRDVDCDKIEQMSNFLRT